MDDIPDSFTWFSSLPPELQFLVWEHALAECFYENAPVRVARYISNGRRARHFRKTSKVEIVTIVRTKRVEWKWMPLRLSCKMADEVARNEKLYPEGWF